MPQPSIVASASTLANASAKPLLSVRSVTKRFGAKTVLRDLSLGVAEGEFLSVLGESGSGKTTLLRLIAGFEACNAGEIWMSGERLDLLPPYRRNVNTVFQSYALFPHLSVFENVAYGLRVRGAPATEVKPRVEDALALVKMSDYAPSSPTKISGGQQQRVALARALVNRPRMLLLDEPLSALDANLRRQMQLELKTLQRELGIAFLFVTHDQEEAMTISDRIALLHEGELEQIAAPQEIYRWPATSYVAQFIGQTNLLRANITAGTAVYGDLRWPTTESDGPACFSLRPESIAPAKAQPMTENMPVRFHARAINRVFQGAAELWQLETAGGTRLLMRSWMKQNDDDSEFCFYVRDIVRVKD